MASVIRILPLMLGLAAATERPIIGVVVHEIISERTQNLAKNSSAYLASSYVKAVEASGARVMPILLGKDEQYYLDTMENVNGILFPGGDAEFDVPNGYGAAAKIIYKNAMKMNDKGDYMPILGVCLGFELLMHLANDNKELRADCNSSRVGLALKFKPEFVHSKLFRDADPSILQILSTQPVTSNHHSYCVTEQNFTKYGLDKEWDVISTNDDSNGLEFISTVESKKYPFVGVQFHPEKNAYEWKKEQNNPHTPEAIYSARYFFDWLNKESRKSEHKFPNQLVESDSLISKYSSLYTGALNMTFREIYVF